MLPAAAATAVMALMASAHLDERQSLGVISSFVVEVVGLDEHTSALGITEDEVREQVELALRRSRIRVANDKLVPGRSAPGLLSVLVRAVANTDAGVGAVYYHIDVNQVVTLVDGDTAVGSTWSMGAMLMTGTQGGRVHAMLREGLGGLMDSLCNAYLEAREKRGAARAKTKVR